MRTETLNFLECEKEKYSDLPKVIQNALIQNALINLMEDVGGAIGTKLMGST